MLPSLRTKLVCFVAVGVVASFFVYRWLKAKEGQKKDDEKDKKKQKTVETAAVVGPPEVGAPKEKSQYENLSALEAVIEARQASSGSNRGQTPPLSVQDDVKKTQKTTEEEMKVDVTQKSVGESAVDVTQVATVEMPVMVGAEMGGAVAKAAV